MKLTEPFLYTVEWKETWEEYDQDYKGYLKHWYHGEGERTYLNTRTKTGNEHWDGGTTFK